MQMTFIGWRLRGLSPRAFAFCICIAPHCASVGAASNDLTDLLNAPPQVVRARIDSASAQVHASLTPLGQEATKRSLGRFYKWAGAYCSDDGDQQARNADIDSCLRNQYINYLARIPNSVYRVANWTAYETGIYGLIWADDDLQGQDESRPFTWDLQVIWPRIDAVNSPLSDGFSKALAAQVHTYESSWASSGWGRWIEVRIAGISECYVSATVTGSTYSGGAHPYEDYGTFNWDRRTKRPIAYPSLFQANPVAQTEALGLYKKRLGQSAAGISDESLLQSMQSGFLLMDGALRIIEQEGRSRIERLPEIDIPFEELSALLLPAIPCNRVSAKPSGK